MKTVGLTFPEEQNAAEFICPHCGKAYKTEAALAKHVEKEHPEGK